MNTCEVCQDNLKGPEINLGSFPLPDDLYQSKAKSMESKTFKQHLILCSNCLTAHQKFQVPKNLLFKENYHYRASLTKDVVSGMENLVDSLNEFKNLNKDSVILDIGANDGTLLNIFKKKYNCTTIAVEPTNSIKSASNLDHIFQEFFDFNTVSKLLDLDKRIDVITFTNVFAHIENLPELISNLKKLLNKDTMIVIENHYLGEIINQKQFDSFYHEHPRTYSVKSFKYIAKSLGLNITNVQFPERYGGNIRVMFSRKKGNEKYVDKFSELDFENLGNYYQSWKTQTKQFLSENNYKFIGKSLPARAVMLINALEVNSSIMEKTYEQDHSPKVNNYVPGTDIYIEKDSNLLSENGKPLILWSWHIRDEIINYLKNIGYKGDVYTPLPEFKKIISL